MRGRLSHIQGKEVLSDATLSSWLSSSKKCKIPISSRCIDDQGILQSD